MGALAQDLLYAARMMLKGSRAASSLLYEVSPLDPLSYAAIAVALAAVTLLACWLPAGRVMRVDPMVALRCE